MTASLPQDHYAVLGLTKDATKAQIGSAWRKLCLKCHPDKFQNADPKLKEEKREEFEKIGQAYAILGNQETRDKYDAEVKLMELRKELGKSGPAPEIRTAEPRPSTYKARPQEPSKTKIYVNTPPRSWEDNIHTRVYDEPPRSSRKATGYDDRKYTSSREDELRRAAKRMAEERKLEEMKERERERAEREYRRQKHSESKKSRDKERKKSTEEKHATRSRTVYAEDQDDSSDDRRRSDKERRSSRKTEESRREKDATHEKIRTAEKILAAAKKMKAQEVEESYRTAKVNDHQATALEYMQARRSAATGGETSPRIGLSRAQTFQEPSYNVRYASAEVRPSASSPYAYEDVDLSRRSSGHTTRRTAEPVASPIPSKSSRKDRKGSVDPYDASPSPASKNPTLRTYSSAPPIVPDSSRGHPARSKTMQPEYVSSRPMDAPPMARAQTYATPSKSTRGSKLKVEYDTSDSSSDSEPEPPRRRAEPEPVRYVINEGRALPRQRSEREDSGYFDMRERSESPRATPQIPRRSNERDRPAERPQLHRTYESARSPHHTYYSTSPTEAAPVRPKLARETSSSRTSSRKTPGYTANVSYSAPIRDPVYVNYPMRSREVRAGS